jgi:hypothetical protein
VTHRRVVAVALAAALAACSSGASADDHARLACTKVVGAADQYALASGRRDGDRLLDVAVAEAARAARGDDHYDPLLRAIVKLRADGGKTDAGSVNAIRVGCARANA